MNREGKEGVSEASVGRAGHFEVPVKRLMLIQLSPLRTIVQTFFKLFWRGQKEARPLF
jgi:hypothetical protein